MADVPMYHDGSRELQDRFATRSLADRLADVLARDCFAEADREFIESRPLFFLSTADARGRPECSYKGGEPGFVRVLDPQTLAFPSYDGNGMFKSLGNILVNPYVGMLFIDFESPKRLRVNGRATMSEDDPASGVRGCTANRARASRGNFSELSPIHSQNERRRAVTLHPKGRLHSASARMEAAA